MDTHSDLPQQMNSGGGIGALLRASRLRRGEELEDIAAALRIRRVYIEAIEEDRFDDLPGHAYAVGFVRGYSEYLGLDGEDIVRRFKEESNVPAKPAELSFPSFIPQHGMPRGAVLMIGVLIAALGYGGWYFLSTQDRFVAEVVTPVPSRLQPEAVQETAPAAAANAASVQPVTDEPETAQSPTADPEATETMLAAAPASSDAPETAQSPAADPEVTETTLAAIPASSDAPSAPPEPVETPAIVASAPEAAVEPSAEPAPPEVTEAVETPAPSPMAETDATASGTAPTADSETVETAPAGATEPKPAAETTEASTEPAAETAQAGTAAAPQPPAMPDTPAADEPAPEPDPTQVALNDTGQPATESVETQIAAVQPAIADETPASAAPEEEPRIVVRAKIASWVQVRDDTENQSIMTRLLKVGDVYEVPNRSGLVLMTGNAGALEITVDGEVVPSIGDAGTVRRHVALEPDRLKDGTAVVE